MCWCAGFVNHLLMLTIYHDTKLCRNIQHGKHCTASSSAYGYNV